MKSGRYAQKTATHRAVLLKQPIPPRQVDIVSSLVDLKSGPSTWFRARTGGHEVQGRLAPRKWYHGKLLANQASTRLRGRTKFCRPGLKSHEMLGGWRWTLPGHPPIKIGGNRRPPQIYPSSRIYRRIGKIPPRSHYASTRLNWEITHLSRCRGTSGCATEQYKEYLRGMATENGREVQHQPTYHATLHQFSYPQGR